VPNHVIVYIFNTNFSANYIDINDLTNEQ